MPSMTTSDRGAHPAPRPDVDADRLLDLKAAGRPVFKVALGRWRRRRDATLRQEQRQSRSSRERELLKQARLEAVAEARRIRTQAPGAETVSVRAASIADLQAVDADGKLDLVGGFFVICGRDRTFFRGVSRQSEAVPQRGPSSSDVPGSEQNAGAAQSGPESDSQSVAAQSQKKVDEWLKRMQEQLRNLRQAEDAQQVDADGTFETPTDDGFDETAPSAQRTVNAAAAVQADLQAARKKSSEIIATVPGGSKRMTVTSPKKVPSSPLERLLMLPTSNATDVSAGSGVPLTARSDEDKDGCETAGRDRASSAGSSEISGLPAEAAEQDANATEATAPADPVSPRNSGADPIPDASADEANWSEADTKLVRLARVARRWRLEMQAEYARQNTFVYERWVSGCWTRDMRVRELQIHGGGDEKRAAWTDGQPELSDDEHDVDEDDAGSMAETARDVPLVDHFVCAKGNFGLPAFSSAKCLENSRTQCVRKCPEECRQSIGVRTLYDCTTSKKPRGKSFSHQDGAFKAQKIRVACFHVFCVVLINFFAIVAISGRNATK